MPDSTLPAGAFIRLDDVLDRPVISPIQPDEPVVEARMAAKGSGMGLGPLIPPGMRAVSVRVNDVVGVAGFVLPGMRVDVLVTGQAAQPAGYRTRNGAAEYRGAVRRADDPDRTAKASRSCAGSHLLVTPPEAESLTLANNEGHIQLVLRNSNDQKVAATHGQQVARDLMAARPRRRRRLRRPGRCAAHAAAAAPAPPARMPDSSGLRPAAPRVVEDQMIIIRGKAKSVEIFARGGESR